MGEEQATADRAQAHQQRSELQQRITDWLDIPLTVLAFGMLGLLTLELTPRRLSP
jgi:hypothetical protein